MSSKSSLTPQSGNAPETKAGEPVVQEPVFQRGRIIWGRPPEVVFRAGPLPRSEGMARLMAMEPKPSPAQTRIAVSGATAAPTGLGGGVAQPGRAGNLGGFSNVPTPRAAGAPMLPTTNVPTASPKVLPQSLVPQPAPKAPEKVESVEASPVETAPKTFEEPMSVLEPVVARRKPVADVEEAEIIAPKPVTASGKTSSKTKWILLAGGAVVAIGAALWWFNREPAETVPVANDTVVETPQIAPVVEEGAAETAAAQGATAENGASVTLPTPAPAARSNPVTAPANVRQDTPAQTAPRPASRPAVTSPRPAEAAPPPVTTDPAPIVIQTPAPVAAQTGPAPTVAEPVQSDPDAPVVTRPQKLD